MSVYMTRPRPQASMSLYMTTKGILKITNLPVSSEIDKSPSRFM
jgi:hypothetical protein